MPATRQPTGGTSAAAGRGPGSRPRPRPPKDGPASGRAGRAAVGRDGIVLRHQVAAIVQLFPAPAARHLPAYSVTPRTTRRWTEQQVHLVFARLPRVRDLAGRGRLVRAPEKGLLPVDVDRRAAARLARQCMRVGRRWVSGRPPP